MLKDVQRTGRKNIVEAQITQKKAYDCHNSVEERMLSGRENVQCQEMFHKITCRKYCTMDFNKL